MKKAAILITALLIVCPTYLASAGGSSELMLAESRQNSIHMNFVRAISAQEYESALEMLHPNLSREWTLARFTRDWTEIRDQASSDWRPEVTGTFTGNSPQGMYEQATFRLVSDWRSISSVDLVSMHVNGKPRIVRIHIRVPHEGAPSKDVEARTGAFVASMQREQFDTVQAMFDPSTRRNFPPALLAQVRPILGPTSPGTSMTYYRLSANTVWYDAVRLGSPDDPATFLELIMDSTASPIRIMSMTFKGRLR
ncbi:MAG: hypothetical protein OEN55_03100 [Alphaproteobacteria bacterium]|nr:hypothetical protein [Alphaproteobacteria bacterium]